jgi:ABC-type glycerol-3-phosphate transport system substrate-binding protein
MKSLDGCSATYTLNNTNRAVERLYRKHAGRKAADDRNHPSAAKTAVVWWTQGFAHQEDVAFRQIVSDYEKASGNIIDYTIIPCAPPRQKIISALTSGDVPDSTRTITPRP